MEVKTSDAYILKLKQDESLSHEILWEIYTKTEKKTGKKQNKG